MLVAGPNETDTTSESPTDGQNDFKGFKPSSILEKQLLEATQKPPKKIKEEKFDSKSFIAETKRKFGTVDMKKLNELYEESKLKLDKIKSIA